MLSGASGVRNRQGVDSEPSVLGDESTEVAGGDESDRRCAVGWRRAGEWPRLREGVRSANGDAAGPTAADILTTSLA